MSRSPAFISCGFTFCGAALWLSAALAGSAAASDPQLADQLRKLEPNVIAVTGQATDEERERLRRMIGRDVGRRLREANLKDVESWRKIDSREQWEQSTRGRIEALRRSLGDYPQPPQDLHVRVTRSDERDGFVVENVVFESRPGLLVTAHLYRPRQPAKSMPGIIISHSHHRPKEQGELQDMGANWARRGCLVVVPDHVGHGERRQHPFVSADDYADEFPVSRQDYHFRYNVGMQLHIAGDSLMGWMAWDLSRCVDLLLSQPGIDKEAVIVLGAVAGGGDPCAVAAALDPRIAAAVPFNFGGPQPETTYPLPEDAETKISYSGSGGWEPTRNLRLTARDGFFHYVIVGSIAPRKLIYAHEFSWDRPRDPVWNRFETIWDDFYDARGSLAFAHGFGLLRQNSSEASHCTNIGTPHRKLIDPSFQKWFGIEPPDETRRDRRETPDTLCLAGPDARDIKLQPVTELARGVAAQRIDSMRKQLEGKPPAERRQVLRAAWGRLLGDVEPYAVTTSRQTTEAFAGGHVERFVIGGEREIEVPVVLLSPLTLPSPRGRGLGEGFPPAETAKKQPVVVMFAQSGKAALLEQRAEVIAALLEAGVAVCLPDLRGTGETSPSAPFLLKKGRGRRSEATGISSSELMLGQTLVGSRLKDLRTVLTVLRRREEIDPQRIALWGDSLAEVNGPQAKVEVPLGIDYEPNQSEPLGHLLALLGGLYEDDVAALVAARGGLAGFGATLEGQFCHFPHDVVIPGAATAGDLADVAAAVAPRPLLMAGLVNGVNRRILANQVDETYRPARAAYLSLEADEQFVLKQDAEPDRDFANWLAERLN